ILVSGGIFSHYIDFLHHVLPNFPSMAKEFLFGLGGGIIAVLLFTVGKKIFGKKKAVSAN
ncbi:MAG: DUF808 domain-containing protein, partial [Sphingobacterium sp.]